MTAPTRELPRLLGHYRESIAPALQEEFGYENVMQIPRLTKIVVNMGVGEATRDAKLMDGAVRDLTAITGPRGAAGARPRRRAEGGRGPRPHRHHRPAAGRRPGAQVHRPVQAARGHA